METSAAAVMFHFSSCGLFCGPWPALPIITISKGKFWSILNFVQFLTNVADVVLSLMWWLRSLTLLTLCCDFGEAANDERDDHDDKCVWKLQQATLAGNISDTSSLISYKKYMAFVITLWHVPLKYEPGPWNTVTLQAPGVPVLP